MREVKVGNIVRNKDDGRLFEVLAVYGTSGIGRPLDPQDFHINDKWVILLNNLEVVLDEETEAFTILYDHGSDS